MFSKQVNANKRYLEDLPSLLTVGNIEMFLKHMKNAKLYSGNHVFSVLYYTKYAKV